MDLILQFFLLSLPLTPRRLSITQIGKKGLNILARTISQTLSGQKINKGLRPFFDIDQYVIESEKPELGQDIWYLTGEIELSGNFNGKEWEAVVYTQPFLEAVLGLIQFGYPDHK